jgi:hypothetical protein
MTKPLICLLLLSASVANAQNGYDVRNQVMNSIASAICNKIGDDGRYIVEAKNRGVSREKMKMSLNQIAEQHPDQINSDRLALEFTLVDIIYAQKIRDGDGGYLAGKQLCLQSESE